MNGTMIILSLSFINVPCITNLYMNGTMIKLNGRIAERGSGSSISEVGCSQEVSSFRVFKGSSRIKYYWSIKLGKGKMGKRVDQIIQRWLWQMARMDDRMTH